MSLRKAVLRVTFEELQELFGLPEDTTIVSGTPNNNNGAMQFLVVGTNTNLGLVPEGCEPPEIFIEYDHADKTETEQPQPVGSGAG
jgi:hypothetical protein